MSDTRGWTRVSTLHYCKFIGNHGFHLRWTQGKWRVSYNSALDPMVKHLAEAKRLAHRVAEAMEGGSSAAVSDAEGRVARALPILRKVLDPGNCKYGVADLGWVVDILEGKE